MHSVLPRLSEVDPAEGGEGPIDPLGLAMLATRLADELVPGFSERSLRARVLSVICVGSSILSRLPRGPYGEHRAGPANVAFERLVLESFAWNSPKGSPGIERIQGIGKAREAKDSGARLTRRLYLTDPGAAGLWVAYKALGVNLGLIDEDGVLRERGFELVQAWERGIGSPGLLTAGSAKDENTVALLLEALTGLLEDRPEGRMPKSAWNFLYENLNPGEITDPERRVIRTLLEDPGTTRAELFGLVAQTFAGSPEEWLDEPESNLYQHERLRTASEPLRHLLDTIAAYERVAGTLRTAFSSLQVAAGIAGDGRISAERILANPHTGVLFREAPDRLARSLDALWPLINRLQSVSALAAETLGWLDTRVLGSPSALFEALLAEHLRVQAHKPPEGKRPWIEGDLEACFVRTRYFLPLDEPLDPERWVHPYRSRGVRRFLLELAWVKP